MARMTEKGQVVIPKAVRDGLNLKAGEELIVERRGQEVVIRRPVDIFNYKPPRPRREVGLTDREITDIAWEDHVSKKFRPKADA